MSRYPYTEAYDAMREKPERAEDGISTKLSRSDCAQLCRFIGEAIKMDAHELACKIADYSRLQRGEDA